MLNGSLPEKRRALIIAVSEYNKRLESLPFCENDGEAVYRVLKSLAYHIPPKNKRVSRVNGNQMRDAIYNFFSDETINSQDTVVFYYSGHGIPDADDVYLAPSDVDPKKPFIKGFPFDGLTKMMNRCNSTRVVTILDCCYSGAARISKGNQDDAARIGRSFIDNRSNSLNQGEGKCILSASQAYQEAYGKKKGDHSVFTYYLLQGLKKNKESSDPDGNVTVDTLGIYLYSTMVNLRLNQKPVRKVEAGGKIILATYPELARRPNSFVDTEYEESTQFPGRLLDALCMAQLGLSDIEEHYANPQRNELQRDLGDSADMIFSLISDAFIEEKNLDENELKMIASRLKDMEKYQFYVGQQYTLDFNSKGNDILQRIDPIVEALRKELTITETSRRNFKNQVKSEIKKLKTCWENAQGYKKSAEFEKLRYAIRDYGYRFHRLANSLEADEIDDLRIELSKLSRQLRKMCSVDAWGVSAIGFNRIQGIKPAMESIFKIADQILVVLDSG